MVGSGEIVVVFVRKLSYEDAKNEISEYIQRAGGRKVYITELAEELKLGCEQIMEIMKELDEVE